MYTKLTLRLEEDLIRKAKKQAKENGKSLSQMVADYFLGIKHRWKGRETEDPLTPLVTALKGSFRGAKTGLKDYQRHLEEKYL